MSTLLKGRAGGEAPGVWTLLWRGCELTALSGPERGRAGGQWSSCPLRDPPQTLQSPCWGFHLADEETGAGRVGVVAAGAEKADSSPKLALFG